MGADCVCGGTAHAAAALPGCATEGGTAAAAAGRCVRVRVSVVGVSVGAFVSVWVSVPVCVTQRLREE